MEKYDIPYILMHTTNLYPTPCNLVRLGAMQELKENFPNAIIGLSDHTINNNACLAATALGACVLERHFTIDFAYATIVAIKPIKKGEKFTKENIWVKRPGKVGILAKNYDKIIGKEATIDIANDTHILWSMIK